jgi:acyl carrier protein
MLVDKLRQREAASASDAALRRTSIASPVWRASLGSCGTTMFIASRGTGTIVVSVSATSPVSIRPRLYHVAEPNIGLSLLDPTLANRLGYGRDVRGGVMQDRIRDVLAAHGRMAVDPREVDDQADLYKLGLTSHASVDVMLALEDAFGVEFPDEVLKKSTFASVHNIEQVVEGLVTSSA